MNKTLGTTLLVSGTMIGAGMLAMPLTLSLIQKYQQSVYHIHLKKSIF